MANFVFESYHTRLNELFGKLSIGFNNMDQRLIVYLKEKIKNQ